MAKQRLFDLVETKGTFLLTGIVSGTEKDSFYSEKRTKTDRAFRRVNFGVEYEKGHTVYINLQGTEADFVYYSHKTENNTNEIEKVPWANRYSFNKEGFSLIGNRLGLTKKADEKGNLRNDNKMLTDFDACGYIHEHLKDGDSVFIKGNIDISSFKDDKGNKKLSLKLKPTQISLCQPIDFASEEYQTDKKQNDFAMPIVMIGIGKETDDNGKLTNRCTLSAKIINYASIEDFDFIIDESFDGDFVKTMRKNIKPYNCIKVYGKIVNNIEAVDVTEEDETWGAPDPFKKTKAPSKTELIITGAYPSTLDRELYSKEAIDNAMEAIMKANKAENNYGSDVSDISEDDWGSVDGFDDEDEPW